MARPASAPLAYRVDDVGAIIGVSRSKVWELIKDGKIPARKIDGATIVLRRDLESYLETTPPRKAAQSAMS